MTYKHFLGEFDSLEEVWQRYPSGGQEGDYLNVDGQILRWNSIENQWTMPDVIVPPSARNTESVFSDLNLENNLSVGGILRARVVRGRSASCGLFVDEAALLRNFPQPLVGQWALIMIENRTDEDGNAIGRVYVCETDGQWQNAGYNGGFDGEYDALLTEREERKEGDAFLKEQLKDIQKQIDDIVKDKDMVKLKAEPNAIFVGEESEVSLLATTNTEATNIKIKKGPTVIASGSGFSLSGYDTVTPEGAGDISYQAEFLIAGLLKSASKVVATVYPIKYGAGQSYSDAGEVPTPRTSPAGTYQVAVANDGDYVFFVVPSTMTIAGAKMSGFDFPLQAPVDVEIDGVAYKYYQSANTYDAGTLTIVIS